MIDLRVAYGFSKINLLKQIAKLECTRFRVYLIPLARFESVVIALFRFF